ncbi:hypothetical protein ACJU26_01255 [Acidithiobacillus sp. M4-SHS-6]|uniref:hypothetical protein n=1 Tax=Acidithiobacillus sp. M4-SHS-6 TaxID=3383024 RepID=UPI0039BEC216
MADEQREPEDLAVAFLQLLCGHGGSLSANAVATRLQLRRSQVERLAVLLGEDTDLGGLGYLAREEKGLQLRFRLTEKGESLCQANQDGEW